MSSEQGSALVLVMFIVLLLTILGVGVLSATIGGATRTETRENDVQSIHLAQKKIDEVMAYVTADVNQKIQNYMGRPQADLDLSIQNFLVSLNNEKNGFVSSTSLNGAANGITSITLDKGASTNSKYVIVIRANATVNGVVRTLQQKVEVSTFPDFLNYSLGSEGIVYLNGAPYIEGKLYAGIQLMLSPVAKYKYFTESTKTTLYPRIDGEAQVQSLKDMRYSTDGTAYEDIPVSDKETYSKLDDRVKQVYENSQVKKQSTFVQIDVEDSFLDKVAEASGSAGNKTEFAVTYFGAGGKNSAETPTTRGTRLVDTLQEPAGNITTLKMPVKSDYDQWVDNTLTAEELKWKRQELYDAAVREFKQKLISLGTSTIIDGNLNLDGTTYNEIKDLAKAQGTEESHWLIVNGDLTVDNSTIQANILVTGNLHIKGEVKLDSTMFVLGSTDVVNANISGKNDKELVLISKGSVLINRIEEFRDEATRLKGFFYTDSTAELYGVGSIFSLEGGFFAKGDLTINAVVGKVYPNPGQPEFRFEDQNQEGEAAARFVIRYNEDVFADQRVGLPRVTQVNIHLNPIELLAQTGETGQTGDGNQP
ncbi:hypothetical protein [Paenibacillus rhizophilus]|uniref:Uncharacterized protein n=1 Tax=Paenibacillus rhizophilus TaxID=1850366 RepID=A0A3N9P1K8_9BACL|nr:hypothetical protein [Paenibacillus rhizophilus]RQW10081.1 hypothetical protein EH198_16755 [Paenibacillus rhizophilus]